MQEPNWVEFLAHAPSPRLRPAALAVRVRHARLRMRAGVVFKRAARRSVVFKQATLRLEAASCTSHTAQQYGCTTTPDTHAVQYGWCSLQLQV
jgi:hypothetical protein